MTASSFPETVVLRACHFWAEGQEGVLGNALQEGTVPAVAVKDRAARVSAVERNIVLVVG